MKAAYRFSLIVSLLTVAIMYLAITKLIPIISQFENLYPVLKWVSIILTGFGVYRLLFVLLEYLFTNLKVLKKFILGPSYVEGTWVGFVLNNSGDLYYVVEVFEQDLESVVVRGKSFTSDGQAHAHWTSEGATINPYLGKLTYTYSCDVLADNKTQGGVGVFHFEREKSSSSPKAIHGYIADLVDGVRFEAKEKKVSDAMLSFDSALEEAKIYSTLRRASATTTL